MRRAYDAFNPGDIDTLTEVFDESAVWHLPGRSSMANDYRVRTAPSSGNQKLYSTTCEVGHADSSWG
jgi:ketosteroid isomerase-like protein